MADLLQKYKPRTLDDVRGQSEVTRLLKQFAKDPYPVAMLFHGETGVGKGCAAYALARALGCDPDQPDRQLGGVYEIPSGAQNADSVKQVIRDLSYRPMFGSGWRVLICNECDRMSSQAEVIWLDVLEPENLPPNSVIIFTTNEPGRLSQRFRDRCEVYAFESETDRLKPHIKALAKYVWKAEGCKGQPPQLDQLGMPTLAGEEGFHASFRLAMKQLVHFIRDHKAGGNGKVAAKQVNKSLGLHQDPNADCDYCHENQPVVMGQRQHKCRACGKTFNVIW